MVDEEKVNALLQVMADATKRMASLGSSNPMAQRNGVEAKYGQAYQELVRLGVRPQLRRKYRGR